MLSLWLDRFSFYRLYSQFLEDAHRLVPFVQHETTFAQMDKSAEKK